MTPSKEDLADDFIEHEGQGGFKPTFVRKAFLAGFDAAESRYKEALEIFDNRRKLAHSLREESPQVAAFVEAIGVEIDKSLTGKLREG